MVRRGPAAAAATAVRRALGYWALRLSPWHTVPFSELLITAGGGVLLERRANRWGRGGGGGGGGGGGSCGGGGWGVPRVDQVTHEDEGPEWAPEVRHFCARTLGVPHPHVYRNVEWCDHVVLVCVDLGLTPAAAAAGGGDARGGLATGGREEPRASAAAADAANPAVGSGRAAAKGGGNGGQGASRGRGAPPGPSGTRTVDCPAGPTVASVVAAVASRRGSYRWASAAEVACLPLFPAGCARCGGHGVDGEALRALLASVAAGRGPPPPPAPAPSATDRAPWSPPPPAWQPDWARLGWAAPALAWIRASTVPDVAVREVKVWEEGVTMRLLPAGGAAADDPPLWFKACRPLPPLPAGSSPGEVPPAGADEVRLTVLLVAHFPVLVPRVVRADAARQWMVLADAGEPLDADVEIASAQSWVDLMGRQGPFLATYARAKVASSGMVDELLAVGCRDLRPNVLVEAVREALRVAATLLPARPPARDDAPSSGSDEGDASPLAMGEDLLAVAQQLCDALDRDTRVRPGMVHQDLHGGNMLRAPDGAARLSDWSQAIITHPYLGVYVGVRVPRAYLRALGVDADGDAAADALMAGSAPLVHLLHFVTCVQGAAGLGAATSFGQSLRDQGLQRLHRAGQLLRERLRTPPPEAADGDAAA